MLKEPFVATYLNLILQKYIKETHPFYTFLFLLRSLLHLSLCLMWDWLSLWIGPHQRRLWLSGGNPLQHPHPPTPHSQMRLHVHTRKQNASNTFSRMHSIGLSCHPSVLIYIILSPLLPDSFSPCLSSLVMEVSLSSRKTTAFFRVSPKPIQLPYASLPHPHTWCVCVCVWFILAR